MTTYRYDGSFAGFLCILADLFARGTTPTAITRRPSAQGGLFDTTIEVSTDEERAAEMLAIITRTVSPYAAQMAHRAFLSDADGAELAIWRYLALGREVGGRLDGMLAHPQVAPVHRLVRKVGHEAHRLKGFVRFREVTERFWYAAVEPDHDVIGLVAPHFAARFRDQHWVIHDLNRGRGIVHDADRRAWIELELERCAAPAFTREEEQFVALWRRYFTEIAIAGRDNPDLQKSRLPSRYRRHLVEFPDGRLP